MSREYATVDKTTWGPGSWQAEPDKVQWVDPATDLDCLMVRNGSGSWCGYVGVAAGHPWFGIGYSGCLDETHPPLDGHSCHERTPEALVDVHGGLTFADACSESEDPAVGICHVPEPGRPEHVWWFGFDCAHFHDLSPAFRMRDRELGACNPEYARLTVRIEASGPPEVYRDRTYVEGEIRRLAQQIATVPA